MFQVVGEGGVQEPHLKRVVHGGGRDVEAEHGHRVRSAPFGIELLVACREFRRRHPLVGRGGVPLVHLRQRDVVVEQRGVDPVRAAHVQYRRPVGAADIECGPFGGGLPEDRLGVVRDLVLQRGQPPEVRARVGPVVDVVEPRLAARHILATARARPGHAVLLLAERTCTSIMSRLLRPGAAATQGGLRCTPSLRNAGCTCQPQNVSLP